MLPAMIDVAAALTDIEAYLARTGIAEGTFGHAVVGDAGFLERLRNKTASVGKAEKAVRFTVDVPEPPRRGFVRAARQWSADYDGARDVAAA